MKKLTVVLLTLLSVCLCACACAEFSDPLYEKGYYYDVENGGATIISYGFDNNNPQTSLNIPAELGGYPVTKIGYNAFDGCDWLKKVVLPPSIVDIGWYAFSGCTSLSEIEIPFYGLESIGKYAFSDCVSLKSIDLPESLVQIYGHAFQNCRSLTSIAIPSNVDRITNFTFDQCFSLKEITIKGQNTRIYSLAFSGYYNPFGHPYMNDAVLPCYDPSTVVFTCWPGENTDTEYAIYSPESYAKKLNISKIVYLAAAQESVPSDADDVQLPPPIVIPVKTVFEDLPDSVKESKMPIFIQSDSDAQNVKVTYPDGTVYSGSVFVEAKVTKVNGNTIEFNLTPRDSKGEKLNWQGKAEVLLTYQNIEDWFGIRKNEVKSSSLYIRHEYASGAYEYFSNADKTITYNAQGAVIEISTLSPFTYSSKPFPEDSAAGKLPKTGDSSLPLVLLSMLLVGCIAVSCRLSRKEA